MNIKRMLMAFVLAVVLFYALKFVITTIFAIVIAIAVGLLGLYVFYRYIAPRRAVKNDTVEDMEFEELD